MHAIGKLVFCDCGDLLPQSTVGSLVLCECCEAINTYPSFSTATVTQLNPKSLPSALRSKRSDIRELTKEDKANQQMSGENCPECDAPNMMFMVAQLRSADEGSTVFYHCLKCGHKHNTNN